jgi:hypothetical protein
MTEFQGELLSTLEPLAADAIDKVNAGAALAYAIYHCPKGDVKAFFDAMPDGVARAYMKACEAYGIGQRATHAVHVADQADPIMRLEEPK